MTELEAAIAAKFRHLSLPALIARIEKAPDFGYDDESVELSRRLRESGESWRWVGDRIAVIGGKNQEAQQ